jgi:hypothetical protein
MTARAETQEQPQDERTPVNVKAFAYFRKLIEESPDGLVSVQAGERQLVICDTWFENCKGDYKTPPDGWWDKSQAWIVIRVCAPDADPQGIALETVPGAQIESLVAFRPYQDGEFESSSMTILGRGVQTIELPFIGVVKGDQHSPAEYKGATYTKAKLLVANIVEAERIGTKMMNIVKTALGENEEAELPDPEKNPLEYLKEINSTEYEIDYDGESAIHTQTGSSDEILVIQIPYLPIGETQSVSNVYKITDKAITIERTHMEDFMPAEDGDEPPVSIVKVDADDPVYNALLLFFAKRMQTMLASSPKPQD